MNHGRHNRLFGFEADFSGDLRCIPMAVRRKLDLAGVKLKLVHWHGLSGAERHRLLDWSDAREALLELRRWLLERSETLPQGPARPFDPPCQASWQQGEVFPEELCRSCRQLVLTLPAQGWERLDELERFALVKLSHPGHEHRNLHRALQECGLIP
ncbi:MAG: nitrate reductase associated protein [Cyanobium sp.]